MTKANTTPQRATVRFFWAVLPGLLLACSKDEVAIGQQHKDAQVSDGNVATGGAGGTATGGAIASGGAVGNGGQPSNGGAVGTGGLVTTGGRIGTGGVVATGGNGSGGRVSTGGMANGGAFGTGGAGGLATGGSRVDAAADLPILADTASDPTRTCGGPDGMPCGTGELCDPLPGSCQTVGASGTCKSKPQQCTTDYQPVCGCDGQTYRNECSRLLAGVTKRSDGECAVTSLPCPQLTTKDACDARGDCHSVFFDPNNCACAAPGCCAQYSHCATGGRAICNAAGTVACGSSDPYCAGDYVIAYTSTCFEGCVLKTRCAATDAGVATPSCPQAAPTQGTACGSTTLSCFYDNCPTTGRTQATCSGGTWSVQTGACGAFTCAGYPDAAFTCASGKVCIVSAGGAINATCAANGCGAGPVSEQCIAGASGCTLYTSATTGVTFTCNTCPQGGCP